MPLPATVPSLTHSLTHSLSLSPTLLLACTYTYTQTNQPTNQPIPKVCLQRAGGVRLHGVHCEPGLRNGDPPFAPHVRPRERGE